MSRPRRAPPGRATPIALVRREVSALAARATRGPGEPLGDRAALLLALLEKRGALSRTSSGADRTLRTRSERTLWELVSGGG